MSTIPIISITFIVYWQIFQSSIAAECEEQQHKHKSQAEQNKSQTTKKQLKEQHNNKNSKLIC